MSALVALGCLLLSGGTVLTSLCLLRSRGLRAHLRAYEAALERRLRYLEIEHGARDICRAQLATLAGALALSLAAHSAWPLGAAVLAAVAPASWLARAARARTARIEDQLDAWLIALANTLRANPALGAAIAASAELVAPPLSRELSRVERELRLGAGLDHALAHMAARVSSPTVSAALSILRVARETGGDLSRTLEASAASLREMARLEGVVRTKTAEGRAQTVVIAIAPFALIAMLDAIDPRMLAPLWTTPLGHVITAAAFGLWLLALLLARRIVAVDV